MDNADPPADSESPAHRGETQEGPALPAWSAFIEHLRSGHGIENVPDDEGEAWRLHQTLHGR